MGGETICRTPPVYDTFFIFPLPSPFSPRRTAGGGIEVTQRGAQVPVRAGACGAGQRSGAAAAAMRMEPAALGRGGRPRDAGGGSGECPRKGAWAVRGTGGRGASAPPRHRRRAGREEGGPARSGECGLSAGRAALPFLCVLACPPHGEHRHPELPCEAGLGDAVTQGWQQKGARKGARGSARPPVTCGTETAPGTQQCPLCPVPGCRSAAQCLTGPGNSGLLCGTERV